MAGRPVEDKPRNARVVLRVLPEEHERWQRAARDAGKSFSAWIRELANGAAPAKPKRAAKR